MRMARVVGTVVATRKDPNLEGAKLLLLQLVGSDGRPAGGTQLAVDAIGAGVGDLVLLLLEGRAAGSVLGRRAAPVDAAIVGIVDPTGQEGDGRELPCLV